MDKYRMEKMLGDGSFGSVWLATEADGKRVAIKKMKRKYTNWDECMQLREIKSLRRLSHPFIIKLREVIRENNELFMIFDYMEGNLYELLEWKRKSSGIAFAENELIICQILQGLTFMHRHGFFHRDLKPENILVHQMPTSTQALETIVLRIADFGLARELRSAPPYTEYVSTRWYRAPELLLHSRTYSSPVDIWALACIMVELMTGKPLFPGSSEMDQLFKISSQIGSPTSSGHQEWQEMSALSAKSGISIPFAVASPLATVVTATPAMMTLLESILRWDPGKRPLAPDMLQNALFSKAREWGLAGRPEPTSVPPIPKSDVTSPVNTPTSPISLSPTLSRSNATVDSKAHAPTSPQRSKDEPLVVNLRRFEDHARETLSSLPRQTLPNLDLEALKDYTNPRAPIVHQVPPAGNQDRPKVGEVPIRTPPHRLTINPLDMKLKIESNRSISPPRRHWLEFSAPSPPASFVQTGSPHTTKKTNLPGWLSPITVYDPPKIQNQDENKKTDVYDAGHTDLGTLLKSVEVALQPLPQPQESMEPTSSAWSSRLFRKRISNLSTRQESAIAIHPPAASNTLSERHHLPAWLHN